MSENVVDIKTLLKLVSSNDNIKREKKVNAQDVLTISKFIDEMEMTEGDIKVPNSVIYYNYKYLWKRVPDDIKVNRIVFFRNLNKLFKSGRIGAYRYYFLNESKMDISKAARQEAKIYEREVTKKAKKKRQVKR